VGELLLADEREQVCAYGRRMVADRLVVGSSGNISVRSGDLVAVTPTGIEYAELVPASVTVIDSSGNRVDGDLAPTSEVPLHLELYRQDSGRRAIVHTHAPHATAASTLVGELPAIHYVMGLLGGSVRVAGYARFGTPELAAAAAAALADRHGCLLANHGAVTVGGTLEAAYERAVQLEWLCQVWLVASAAGRPKLLPATELAEITALVRDYGAAGREN
jgi:L-fuculose-phosphate aldolase